MNETDSTPESVDQFIRAVTGKEPGYAEFLETLKEAKHIANEKNISDLNVQTALREVFGFEAKDADV